MRKRRSMGPCTQLQPQISVAMVRFLNATCRRIPLRCCRCAGITFFLTQSLGGRQARIMAFYQSTWHTARLLYVFIGFPCIYSCRSHVMIACLSYCIKGASLAPIHLPPPLPPCPAPLPLVPFSPELSTPRHPRQPHPQSRRTLLLSVRVPTAGI